MIVVLLSLQARTAFVRGFAKPSCRRLMRSEQVSEQLGEVECYIHYHEYDYNKQFPALVVRGDFGISGYRVDTDTGELTSVCICAAHSDNECCCNYNPNYKV